MPGMMMTVAPMPQHMEHYITGMPLIIQQVFVQRVGMFQVILPGLYLIAFWRIMAIIMMEVQRVYGAPAPLKLVYPLP